MQIVRKDTHWQFNENNAVKEMKWQQTCGSIRGGELLEDLSNCQLVEGNSAPWG
jgi:hypothetical protein